ncbi:hypothetical protein [Streptomyces sp. NPDC047453]|uniref:hypothetical protein n=1 Tax=Streptomyces sp. NPDC047453 TaxID=3154812 RepID=UPI0033CD5CD6
MICAPTLSVVSRWNPAPTPSRAATAMAPTRAVRKGLAKDAVIAGATISRGPSGTWGGVRMSATTMAAIKPSGTASRASLACHE